MSTTTGLRALASSMLCILRQQLRACARRSGKVLPQNQHDLKCLMYAATSPCGQQMHPIYQRVSSRGFFSALGGSGPSKCPQGMGPAHPLLGSLFARHVQAQAVAAPATRQSDSGGMTPAAALRCSAVHHHLPQALAGLCRAGVSTLNSSNLRRCVCFKQC